MSLADQVNVGHILSALGFVWKFDLSMGHFYQKAENAWVHFNPYERDVDATMLMLHYKMNLTWSGNVLVAQVGKHVSTNVNWRLAVIGCFLKAADIDKREFQCLVS